MMRSAGLREGVNDCEPLLDLVRVLGAQAVCVGHAISFFGVLRAVQPPRHPYLQNIGVLVFFVLSGFLIGHTMFTKSAQPGYGLREYLIDRFVRIYSGLVPALLIVATVDGILSHLGRYEFPQYLTLRAFLGTLLMLQGYPGPFRDHLAVPSFGSDGPLWTIAVEFHIYVFIGACFFLRSSRSYLIVIATIALSVFVPLTYLFGDVQSGVGTGLFSLWLMGFGACVLVRWSFLERVPTAVLILLTAVVGGLYIEAVIPGREYTPGQYPLLAATFLGVVGVTLRTRITVARRNLRQVIRFLADYSYSLYLVHYTVIYALKQLWGGDPGVGALGAVIAANGVALAMAQVSERRHRSLGNWLKRRLPGAQMAAPVETAAGGTPSTGQARSAGRSEP